MPRFVFVTMVTILTALLALPLRMVVKSRNLLAKMLPVMSTAPVLSAVQAMHFVSARMVSVVKASLALRLTMLKSRNLLAKMLTVVTAPVWSVVQAKPFASAMKVTVLKRALASRLKLRIHVKKLTAVTAAPV